VEESRSRICSLRQSAYRPVQEIPERNDVSGSSILFESLVILESYTANSTAHNRLESLKNSSYSEKHSPLSVIVTLGPEFFFRVRYDSRYFDSATITRLLGH